jgi:hypothetical protein
MAGEPSYLRPLTIHFYLVYLVYLVDTKEIDTIHSFPLSPHIAHNFPPLAKSPAGKDILRKLFSLRTVKEKKIVMQVANTCIICF